MAETALEKIRTNLAAGMQPSADDAWFLIEEISRYRDILRKARYQTIMVSVTAKKPTDDEGPVEFVANAVASEEATERALIREFRRTWIHLIRAGNRPKNESERDE